MLPRARRSEFILCRNISGGRCATAPWHPARVYLIIIAPVKPPFAKTTMYGIGRIAAPNRDCPSKRPDEASNKLSPTLPHHPRCPACGCHFIDCRLILPLSPSVAPAPAGPIGKPEPKIRLIDYWYIQTAFG